MLWCCPGLTRSLQDLAAVEETLATSLSRAELEYTFQGLGDFMAAVVMSNVRYIKVGVPVLDLGPRPKVFPPKSLRRAPGHIMERPSYFSA